MGHQPLEAARELIHRYGRLVEARGKVRAELAKVRAAPDTAALIVQAKVPTRF